MKWVRRSSCRTEETTDFLWSPMFANDFETFPMIANGLLWFPVMSYELQCFNDVPCFPVSSIISYHLPCAPYDFLMISLDFLWSHDLESLRWLFINAHDLLWLPTVWYDCLWYLILCRMIRFPHPDDALSQPKNLWIRIISY